MTPHKRRICLFEIFELVLLTLVSIVVVVVEVEVVGCLPNFELWATVEWVE